jgi:hypothetical protein
MEAVNTIYVVRNAEGKRVLSTMFRASAERRLSELPELTEDTGIVRKPRILSIPTAR